MRSSARVVGLAVGFVADWCFGDPGRGHPVAGFGRVASGVRGVLYADSRGAGVAYAGVLVAGAGVVGVAAEWVGRGRPVVGAALTAAATWTVLGGTSLRREASAIGESLGGGDLAAARERLPHLCGRDPRGLDADQIARAVVESVAENTSDAVVAPLFWGAVAGIPGLLAYRASNTLDAMVGYRNAKYRNFGWASARLDDVLNWVPARFTGVVTVAAAPVVGGSPVRALRVLRRDGARHPSPNAGRCEASAAGALGVRLGGTNTYGDAVEHRPVMGTGRAPRVADIRRAAVLSATVGLASAVAAARLAGALARSR
ncbi:cobalamin biosynthesis protein CobD [Catenulispora acidiphila DSM 44928]|uniref:Cobalamin biosynthesis protein CobD n=1 Tax=Catenulispora acidiphila (strain DSM 44928 / JCM 14897 / NBRC 102108 / NRRL B-24433 / ID139908) TaxID=479433 RepID=C7QIA4_CATAD|nr:cobalamin biosynthesis protein [Catenulispora acidiphila]ACU74981.1 cobalamin biosynthesis protein CobD [Catenulispora acidiphila DSM 44928]